MTDLESFLATTEHRRPGRILYYMDFTPDLDRRVREHIGGANPWDHYGFFQRRYFWPRRPESLPKLDFSNYWHDQELPANATINGDGVAMIPSGYYHFWGYVSPLRNAVSIKEIEGYPLEDYSLWDWSAIEGFVAAAHAKGEVAVGWVGHMYETAWQIRGYEQFLVDMIEQPAWAQCLLDRIHQQKLFVAKHFARHGFDMVFFGDDVANQKAMMFQPDTWRSMMLSRWAKVWGEVKSISPSTRIWYHSDGNIGKIVGDLVNAGVNILNPLQPECLDVEAVYKEFGHRITFDGCMGTQSTMPWGTPDDVRVRVKDLIDRYGRDGGLIISPTHTLEPEVPIANIEALVNACREFGSFD